MIVGDYRLNATFGRGEPNEITLVAPFVVAIFIAKYRPDGSLNWAKTAGSSDTIQGRGISANGICVLPDNAIAVAGYFYSTATFGEGEPNETVFPADGEDRDYDSFVAKYNPEGNLTWVKRVSGNRRVYAMGIASLSDNSLITAGRFSGTATFGQGESNETTLSTGSDTSGHFDAFLAKYTSNGTLDWAKCVARRSDDINLGGVTSAEISTLSDDSVMIAGSFSGSVTFGPGGPNETTFTTEIEDNYYVDEDIFIAKYDAVGGLIWVRRAGGDYIEPGEVSDALRGLSLLPDGSSVITGFFRKEAVFGPGEQNETILTAEDEEDDGSDIFIAKYSPEGALVWAKSAGGDGWDIGGGISALPDGSSTITGEYSYSVTFGAGEPSERTLTAEDYGDIYIAKYHADGSFGWAKSAIGGNRGTGIAVLPDGSAIITGEMNEIAIFGKGESNETKLISADQTSQDIYVAKYNP
ncbi:MAG: hypothetical protein QNJ97_25860 [Myxococcota bacterium]|nr:hypothetical protein [Myxococcota bacterium]